MKKSRFLFVSIFATVLIMTAVVFSSCKTPEQEQTQEPNGVAASNPYSGNLSVKNFSKYCAIGAATTTKAGGGAGSRGVVSSRSVDEDVKDVHLVGLNSDGDIEAILFGSDSV